LNTGKALKTETPVVLSHKKKMTWKRFKRELNRGKYVYLMLLPIVVYYIIFHYWPMYGVVIAFQDYLPGNGFFEGPWVGFKHFTSFFNGFFFARLIKNTVLLNFWGLIFGFPAPII
jgi:putative aldouronate transport system permease protein